MLLAYSFLKQEKKVLLINSDRRSKYTMVLQSISTIFQTQRAQGNSQIFNPLWEHLHVGPRSSRSPNQDGGVSLTKEVKSL